MTRPTRTDPGRAVRDGRDRAAEDQPLVASWDPLLGGDAPDGDVPLRDGPAGAAPAGAAPDVAAEAGAAGDVVAGDGARRRVGPWRRAVATYGWRVYAVPVLVVLTVLAVLDVLREPRAPSSALSDGHSHVGGPADDVQAPLIPNPVTGSGFEAAKGSAELPGGGPFTALGAGTWSVVPGAGEPYGQGELFTYTVELEDGVVLEGGPEGFATTVDSTLDNPKSWIGSGHYRFQRVDDPEAARLRISLTSQETTRRLCGFQIPFDASCWRADQRRVVINNARWVRGAVPFQGNVVQYQQYVVNHEVGHGLGFAHTGCERDGALAPVMMQQTWGLGNDFLTVLGTDRVRNDGKVCEPNAWPFPTVN